MSAQASPYKVHSREITQQASKGEQPFLHATHCLDPIYMPTKYYQNISKGIKVIERTSFCLRTDRRTDRRTDGQTDGRQADRYIPRSFSGRGIKMRFSTKNCTKMVTKTFSFKPFYTFWLLDLNIWKKNEFFSRKRFALLPDKLF